MDLTSLVEKRSCKRTFRVVDPAQYPFASYEFDDEGDIKDAYWSQFAPGHVVIDLGASFGGYTLPALAQGARVIAVEPSPSTIEVLRANVEANGWADRCTIVRAALWDDTPLPEAFRAAAMRNFGDDDRAAVMTLDELVARLELKRVDAIKFDVEGAEGAIIRGGRHALTRFRPSLLIEDHNKDADAPDAQLVPYAIGLRARVLEDLKNLGYEPVCHWREGGGNPFIVAN